LALEDTKKVHYGELMRVLKSTSEENLRHYEKENNILDGQRRFFDGDELPAGQRIAYTTFPRSGNTFLRRYLDQITGVETGANMPLIPTTSQVMMGMRGENIVDERVWVVKTHYPMNMPGTLPFHSNKTIVCVRNPMDVFPSMFNHMSTWSHSVKPDFEVEKEFPEFWNRFVIHKAL
jgi:hypothetical protein